MKGYLTIYVSLSLTVILSLCMTLIEGARQSSIRLETECIMDTAMDSVMAEYHRELFNQYNLLYIDSSYGGSQPSFYNTQARLQHYWEKNLELDKVSYIDFLYKDLLAMQLENLWLTEVVLATDQEGALFQKKAAGVVWDDTGLQLVENVLNWVQVIESKELLERDMAAEKQQVDEQLAAYNGTRKELAKQKWYTVEITNPTQYMNEMRGQGILRWVLEGDATISGQKADLSQYISSRRKRGVLNQGNGSETAQVSMIEQILFHEYILCYSGYYGMPKKGSFLQYQAEYLLGGKSSDEENLRHVAGVLSGIREVANVIYLNQSPSKMGTVKAVSSVLAAAVLCPELEPLFQATLVMGWAYLESLYDTKLLLAGGKVPLLKDDNSWHYDLDSILTSVDMQLKDKNCQGMSYKDYLHTLLYLEDIEKVTFRFMDLVEMDIRQTTGNEAFRMDGCIDRIGAEAVITSEYGYRHRLERYKEYADYE